MCQLIVFLLQTVMKKTTRHSTLFAKKTSPEKIVINVKKKKRDAALMQDAYLIGCRIPKDFFITKGVGESDITVHAGSYHLALRQAGIEMCNIMTYSSILPGVANII